MEEKDTLQRAINLDKTPELEGCVPHIIVRDGHCFYHSVAHQLNAYGCRAGSRVVDYQDIRDKVANWIENSGREFDAYKEVHFTSYINPGNSAEDIPCTLEELADRVRRTTQWAEPNIMRCIIAGCLNEITGNNGVVFDVYYVNPHTREIEPHNDMQNSVLGALNELGSSRAGRLLIRLLWVGRNHFHVLVKEGERRVAPAPQPPRVQPTEKPSKPIDHRKNCDDYDSDIALALKRSLDTYLADLAKKEENEKQKLKDEQEELELEAAKAESIRTAEAEDRRWKDIEKKLDEAKKSKNLQEERNIHTALENSKITAKREEERRKEIERQLAEIAAKGKRRSEDEAIILREFEKSKSNKILLEEIFPNNNNNNNNSRNEDFDEYDGDDDDDDDDDYFPEWEDKSNVLREVQIKLNDNYRDEDDTDVNDYVGHKYFSEHQGFLDGMVDHLPSLDPKTSQRSSDTLDAAKRRLDLIKTSNALDATTPSGYLNKFPDYIQQQILDQKNNSNYQFGIFPEIGQGWACVHNVLHLWNINDGSKGIVSIHDATHKITSVCISTPTKELSKDCSIAYVIVIATTVDVSVVGVECSGPTFSIASERLCLKTEIDNGVSVMRMVGTKWGRVYMLGSDSIIHELAFVRKKKSTNRFSDPQSANEFTSECTMVMKLNIFWKLVYSLPNVFWVRLKDYFGLDFLDFMEEIKVDNVRQIMYCWNKQGKIFVFQLGDDGDIVNHTYTSLGLNAGSSSSSSSAPEIISLYVTPPVESASYCFVVVLKTGTRIFYNAMDANRKIEITEFRRLDPPKIKLAEEPKLPSSRHYLHPFEELESLGDNDPAEYEVDQSYYSKGIFMISASIKSNDKKVFVVIYEHINCFSGSGTVEMVVVYEDNHNFGNLIHGISEQVTHYTTDNEAASLMTAYCLEKLEPNTSVTDFIADGIAESNNQVIMTAAALSPQLPCDALPYYQRSSQFFDPNDDLARPYYRRSALSWGLSSNNVSAVPVIREGSLQHIPINKNLTRHFVVLTSAGVHVLRKLRPSDSFMRQCNSVNFNERLLLDYLWRYSGDESQSSRKFTPQPENRRNMRLKECLVIVLGCICGLPVSDEKGMRGGGILSSVSHQKDELILILKSLLQEKHTAGPKYTRIVRALWRDYDNNYENGKDVDGLMMKAWYTLVSRVLRPIYQVRIFSYSQQPIGNFTFNPDSLELSDAILSCTLKYLQIIMKEFTRFYKVDSPDSVIKNENQRKLKFFMKYNIQYLWLITILRREIFEPSGVYSRLLTKSTITIENFSHGTFDENLLKEEFYIEVRGFLRNLLKLRRLQFDKEGHIALGSDEESLKGNRETLKRRRLVVTFNRVKRALLKKLWKKCRIFMDDDKDLIDAFLRDEVENYNYNDGDGNDNNNNNFFLQNDAEDDANNAANTLETDNVTLPSRMLTTLTNLYGKYYFQMLWLVVAILVAFFIF